MAVKIRLARAGAKKHPIYHLVVADETCPRDGRFIESVGLYDPTATPSKLEVDRERLSYWLSKGATPTDTVKHLIKRALKAQLAA